MQINAAWKDINMSCVYTRLPEWLWVSFRPTFTTTLIFWGLQTTTTCSWRVDFDLNDRPYYWCTRWSGDKQFMWEVFKSSDIYKSSSRMLWPWSSLPVPHSNYKQWEAKKVNYNPSQPLPTTPCIVVGQVRVVLVSLVVINAPYPSKIEPKKVNYNHQPPSIYQCGSGIIFLIPFG